MMYNATIVTTAQEQSRVMIVKCELPSACSGGENSNCSEGYTSRQCGKCLDGFFKYGDKCQKCSASSVVLALHGLLLLCAMLGTWFVLWLVMRDPRIGSPFAFVFRLLETLGILNLTLIRWPGSTNSFLNFVSLVNFNTEMFETEVSGHSLVVRPLLLHSWRLLRRPLRDIQ
jgi:hypothetical protein